MEQDTMIEKEHTPSVKIHELGIMGYGNTDSSISREKQLISGELSADVDARSQEIIMSAEVLVPINDTDDGCIDGRETAELYVVNGESFARREAQDNSTHERAKVAGGGYITSLAIRLGIGKKGISADADITGLGVELAEKGVYCGAHTGSHQHDVATDCGANDKFALILENAITYNDHIKQTTEALITTAGLSFNEATYTSVIDNWKETLGDEHYFEEGTGDSRLQRILTIQAAATEATSADKPAAVTKHLAGDHNEDYIVVNYVPQKTVSQGQLAVKLRAEFPENDDKHLAQAFIVDAWRVVELAQANSEDTTTEAAIYAGVMYQVATAATLTDGTLKMFAYTEA